MNYEKISKKTGIILGILTTFTFLFSLPKVAIANTYPISISGKVEYNACNPQAPTPNCLTYPARNIHIGLFCGKQEILFDNPKEITTIIADSNGDFHYELSGGACEEGDYYMLWYHLPCAWSGSQGYYSRSIGPLDTASIYLKTSHDENFSCLESINNIPNVPEFTTYAGIFTLLAACGAYLILKKNPSVS
jgi:hypothetical protein